MSTVDWSEDPFFAEPAQASVDGGTTSEGDLWHGVSPRWGHSLHSMCSYQGMFPAKVAHYFIQKYSSPGDLVVDPFSGRGTTALQARVEGRRTIANDLSPLAFVLSKAKAKAPTWLRINSYVDQLEREFIRTRYRDLDVSPDIEMLYHPNTLKQLLYVRERLLAQEITAWTPEMLMTAGALAGIMHGATRRDGSSQYLSISMPNTFSMSPTYVAKYIKHNGLEKPDQDVFMCLRIKLARLYLDDLGGPEGEVHHFDATDLLSGSTVPNEGVDLLLTSPPYLRVVNYGAANWIRLWLLGTDEVAREGGAGRRRLDSALDHRHSYETYRSFMAKTLNSVQRSLRPDGVAVIVIGDVADPGKDPLPLAAQVWDDLKSDLDLRLLSLIEDDLPTQTKVSRIWGETKGQATNRDCALVLTPKAGKPVERDLSALWIEPYKDGGPDAAHYLVRR